MLTIAKHFVYLQVNIDVLTATLKHLCFHWFENINVHLLSKPLSLLFLMNPSPDSHFFLIRKKYQLVAGTEPNTSLQQVRTTVNRFAINWPSLIVRDEYSHSVRIQSTGSGLRKISFSFPGGIPLYFEMGMGKGCQFESTSTPLPHIFCFLYLSSLHSQFLRALSREMKVHYLVLLTYYLILLRYYLGP